jgi:ribose transport system substrate-binding protein
MKISKIIILSLIPILIIALMFITSCKKEITEETTSSTIIEETTTETIVAESSISEETTAEDMNELDPFILQNREFWTKYHQSTELNWKGPYDETPSFDEILVLTKAEVEEIRSKNYTYAVCENNLAGEYSVASNKGIDDILSYLGMKKIAFTSADFDPVRQKNDVESVVALKPDLIIGHPTDPTTSAESFMPVVEAGIPLVMLDTLPKGYTYGKEVLSVATDNGYEVGVYCANMMNELIGDKGKLGYVYYDDIYYICNQMDQAFIETIEKKYTTMQVVAKQGYVAESGAGEAAAAIIQRYPEVEGLYTTYMVPAMFMVSACQDAERSDIKIVTFGIDAPVIIDLIEDGNIKALVIDSPWNIGMNLGILGAYALLGKEAPPLVVVPNIIVTNENKEIIREVWQNATHSEKIPDNLDETLKKYGL